MSVAVMLQALRDDPWDDLAYSALADALEEDGRLCEAARYRRGKPTIPDVIGRFRNYYEINPEWGHLHIVLEDNNYDDEDCEYAIKWAKDVGDLEGLGLARLLLRMSRTQRNKLSMIA